MEVVPRATREPAVHGARRRELRTADRSGSAAGRGPPPHTRNNKCRPRPRRCRAPTLRRPAPEPDHRTRPMFDDTEHNPFERIGGKGTVLTVVVHTASFERAILADDPLIRRFLELPDWRYRVVWTPTENKEVQRRLRSARLGEVGEYEVKGEWLVIQKPTAVRHRIPYLGDLHRPAEEGSSVTVLDELFTHPLTVDLFVVADGDPFLKRDPRRRVYVGPEEAFNLVRVLATRREADDSFYFMFRASKLFPAADLPWVAMGIARDHGFPQVLREQIESFRHRIQLILRSADQVAYHTLRRPDGRAASECGYHLAYFIMLVTGLFDELAWTIAHRYGFKLSAPQMVLRQRMRDDAFFRQIQATNPDLHAFLVEPDTQAVIRLFYPARDQVQHRAVLAAKLIEQPAPRRVLAQLPDDTLQEVEALSADQGADWGLADGRAAGQVDPYLFTLAAVQAVASVTNGVLERLEWERYADALPDEIREEKRGYFKSEVGMALMKRLLHEHEPPPYF